METAPCLYCGLEMSGTVEVPGYGPCYCCPICGPGNDPSTSPYPLSLYRDSGPFELGSWYYCVTMWDEVWEGCKYCPPFRWYVSVQGLFRGADMMARVSFGSSSYVHSVLRSLVSPFINDVTKWKIWHCQTSPATAVKRDFASYQDRYRKTVPHFAHHDFRLRCYFHQQQGDGWEVYE